jgi:membrane protease YdiL (CAAX protease family)
MNAVARYLRSRSDAFEFTAIFVVAWLPNIAAAVAWFVTDAPPVAIDDAAIWNAALLDTAVLAIVLSLLRLRGWSWRRLGLAWRSRDLLVGLGVAIGLVVAFPLIDFIVDRGGAPISIAPHLGAAPTLAFSLLNAFYEEVLLCGYTIGLAAARGRTVDGIWATVAIRFLCHAYEGLWVAAEVALMGVAFGYGYARYRRLWPLIIGHAGYDAVVLLGYLA